MIEFPEDFSELRWQSFGMEIPVEVVARARDALNHFNNQKQALELLGYLHMLVMKDSEALVEELKVVVAAAGGGVHVGKGSSETKPAP
jgi:hypothetical protein